MWEVLRNIQLASSQNSMGSSQLACSTQDESCRTQLPIAQVANHPANCTKSVRCCVFVYRDKSRWTTAEVSSLCDINGTFFNGKDDCWCLSPAILAILHATDAKLHVMMYGYHCYSHCSDGQNGDFSLFKSIEHTNLDIKDAAFLYVVQIMQHPTSRPSTKSTHNTMVNVLKKNLLPLLAGKYGTLTSAPHEDVIKWIQATDARTQNRSEPLECCAACDPKSLLQWGKEKKLTS